MEKFKQPESVLVVVFDPNTQQVLLLQRHDDRAFWQSVTGSLELNETPKQAAIRELQEELGLSFKSVKQDLIDCHQSIEFEIFPQFRHRYAPGVTHCREHWFLLPLSRDTAFSLSEHCDYRWMDAKSAVELTKSWNNALAINEFIVQNKINKRNNNGRA